MHQLLPTTPIHDRGDIRTYEYGSAARVQQYYGEMPWGLRSPCCYVRGDVKSQFRIHNSQTARRLAGLQARRPSSL